MPQLCSSSRAQGKAGRLDFPHGVALVDIRARGQALSGLMGQGQGLD